MPVRTNTSTMSRTSGCIESRSRVNSSRVRKHISVSASLSARGRRVHAAGLEGRMGGSSRTAASQMEKSNPCRLWMNLGDRGLRNHPGSFLRPRLGLGVR
jgi:hypothetical protein